MKNNPISNNKTSTKGGYKGEKMWHATRLEGVVKNAGIKSVKKKKKTERV